MKYLDTQKLKRACMILRALNDKRRHEIIKLLLEAPATVEYMSEKLNPEIQYIDIHLSILERQDVVIESTNDKNEIIYTINYDWLWRIINFITQLVDL